MNRKQALDILCAFQEWRRYDGPIGEGPIMPCPKEIGQALDIAIDIMRGKEQMMDFMNNKHRDVDMSKYPKHTPARIFLVMGDEDVTKEDDFLELDEVTWSSEKVFRTDIEYVRKDLYDALKRKLEKAESDSSYLAQYNPLCLNGRPDII